MIESEPEVDTKIDDETEDENMLDEDDESE